MACVLRTICVFVHRPCKRTITPCGRASPFIHVRNLMQDITQKPCARYPRVWEHDRRQNPDWSCHHCFVAAPQVAFHSRFVMPQLPPPHHAQCVAAVRAPATGGPVWCGSWGACGAWLGGWARPSQALGRVGWLRSYAEAPACLRAVSAGLAESAYAQPHAPHAQARERQHIAKRRNKRKAFTHTAIANNTGHRTRL